MSAELSISEIEKIARIIHTCIDEDKPNKIISTLCMLTISQRKSIVTFKIDGRPALYFACLKGNADIMKYLLDECDPDVEQKGLFKIRNLKNDIEAPPLWCATGLDNGLDIIKLLTEYGADVNGPTNSDSTPLISACILLNIPIVEFLVEHGANIRKTTEKGYSGLMAAVASTELCAYLISKGASVNASSMNGYTALHHAAHDHKLETVKLLCRNGGSMTAKTNYQETPLTIAALRGSSLVMKYFLDTYEFPLEEKCDAFDLLGCFLVDDDVTRCVLMWETALRLRFEAENTMTNTVKKVTPVSYFQYAVEITSVESLRVLTEPNDLYMQALLKYSRIYGENHPVSIGNIIYRGALYGDNGCYQRCVELWKYAYTLRFKQDDPLNDDTIQSAISLVNIICKLETKWINKKTKEQVQMTDVLDVFKTIVRQIEGGKSVLTIRPLSIIEQGHLQCLMKLTLHLIRLFQFIGGSVTERVDFIEQVAYLVQIDPRGINNQTLLHLAVDPNITKVGDVSLMKFPSVYVVDILLVCGANTNTRSDDGYDPLRKSIKFSDLPSKKI
ncbi:protein fem-1 homolog C-like isoform X3 [Mytilus californianus]|uniref:protein fem-1 homolog C-like isoform X3 n=1 Tax=Mytilus californianus TaxID=6549 RepID=UPI002245E0ED|nr:protein fem-1 homolog C-like isoform X3 [Mytilus californianus]